MLAVADAQKQAPGPRNICGGRLAGDNLVRMVYIDEAGISNPKHEPYIVVAAVVVHADRQWKKIESHLLKLADKYAPPDKREGFAFHATELFSGGKTFPRDEYSKEYRWKILREVVSIPKKFRLPVIYGFMRNDDPLPLHINSASASEKAVHLHTAAYLMCLDGIEKWMRKNAVSREVAALFAEDNPQARKRIKEAQNYLRDPRKVERARLSRPDLMEGYPLTRIVDTTYFSEKADANPLQIADACAFAIKRRLMGVMDSVLFYSLIRPQIVPLTQSEASSD